MNAKLMHRHAWKRRSSSGFSLIELMVSLAIGLIVTLAITGVLTRSEGMKRTSTSVNDIDQTGAYVAYAVDRALRSAGSGFMQTWASSLGCRVNASKGGTVVMPVAGTPPAPFQALSPNVRLAPVLIGQGLSSAGSDTLTVLAGSGGYGESALRVLTGSVTSSTIGLNNTLSFSPNDLVMIVEDGVGCMVQQVASSFVPVTVPNTAAANQTLQLGGNYASNTGTDANLTQFGVSGNAFLVSLGNTSHTSQFEAFGVGDNNTLYEYDFLQTSTSQATPIADGVVEMRALYGVDTNLDGVLDSWQAPTGTYAYANLNSGSAAARATLRTIVSIKVGFILRTSLKEKDKVTLAEGITLFGDMGPTLATTRTLSTTNDDQYYRYRTVEVTVPLRNVLMLGP